MSYERRRSLRDPPYPLGAGRLALRPWAMADGTIAARKVLPLSLTFDHRAATGGEAGRFLNAVIADLRE